LDIDIPLGTSAIHVDVTDTRQGVTAIKENRGIQGKPPINGRRNPIVQKQISLPRLFRERGEKVFR
jgi:hypothetical protein